MYYILDQNIMRKAQLANALNDPNAFFVVPDTSLVEMVKNAQWEATMKGSFALLTPAVNRCFVSMSVPEAIRHERATRVPVDSRTLLLDEETKILHELILALSSGSSKLDDVRRRITGFRTDLLAEEVDANADKVQLVNLVKLAAKASGPRLAADLRRNNISREAKLGLILDKAARFFTENESFTASEAQTMIDSQSLVLRFYYLRLLSALWWLTYGGWEHVKPAAALNDRLDQEYILIGSFFDQVFTLDQKASGADKDLRTLLDRSIAPTLTAAYKVYTEQAPPVS
jgi:hypothetical protein